MLWCCDRNEVWHNLSKSWDIMIVQNTLEYCFSASERKAVSVMVPLRHYNCSCYDRTDMWYPSLRIRPPVSSSHGEWLSVSQIPKSREKENVCSNMGLPTSWYSIAIQQGTLMVAIFCNAKIWRSRLYVFLADQGVYVDVSGSAAQSCRFNHVAATQNCLSPSPALDMYIAVSMDTLFRN